MFNRRFHKPLFVKRRLYNGSRDFHFTDEPGSIHWRGLYRRVFSLSIQLFDGHMPRKFLVNYTNILFTESFKYFFQCVK